MVIKYIINAQGYSNSVYNEVQITVFATSENKAIIKAKEMINREHYIIIEAKEIRN